MQSTSLPKGFHEPYVGLQYTAILKRQVSNAARGAHTTYERKQVVMVMSSWVKTAEWTHPSHARILCSPLLLAVWVRWTLNLNLDYDEDVSRKLM